VNLKINRVLIVLVRKCFGTVTCNTLRYTGCSQASVLNLRHFIKVFLSAAICKHEPDSVVAIIQLARSSCNENKPLVIQLVSDNVLCRSAYNEFIKTLGPVALQHHQVDF
jgi:hypothetical protein